ncbi:transglutaminase domain-containing protein [Paenibacillus sp. HB172176]|uniref:transglutaminase domain-containing protein n=1 Tax=Paenibacillus sp. HB172176 TaxID=2493690 RepID=UPI00143A1832|nr:transglutaminase domain-containing protein [Paenibacillus sp. HB172176]
MRGIAARLALFFIIVALLYGVNARYGFIPAIASQDNVISLSDEAIIEATEAGAGEEISAFDKLELELSEGFQARADRFSVKYSGDREQLSAEMKSIIRSALARDDYSAYILESYLYTIRSWGNKSTITVEARFRESLEETAEVNRIVDETLAELIRPDMNDHEKIKAIHDWIVTHVEYDQSLTYYTAYDALKLGKTVCQGYSLLGYLMLEKAGLTVRIAEGTVNTGEHAWNMVQLDGNWYHLDLTWDDPVGATDSRIHYSYYLKSDEELGVDHEWTRDYPAAKVSYADSLNQLAAAGNSADAKRYAELKLELGLQWLDSENTVTGAAQLKELIHSAVKSRESSVAFRYATKDGFAEALKAAFQGVGVSVGYRAGYEPYSTDQSLLVSIELNYQ